jgi:hypothetical protein
MKQEHQSHHGFCAEKKKPNQAMDTHPSSTILGYSICQEESKYMQVQKVSQHIRNVI